MYETERVGKEQEVVRFVTGYIVKNQYAPSKREIAEAIGCSLTTINTRINRMTEKGILETDSPGSSRAIRVKGTIVMAEGTSQYEKTVKKTDREIVTYVETYIMAHKYPPTYGEIAQEMECSASRIWSRLLKLEERGIVKIGKNGAQRTIRVPWMSIIVPKTGHVRNVVPAANTVEM